jgi:hypothetical protein
MTTCGRTLSRVRKNDVRPPNGRAASRWTAALTIGCSLFGAGCGAEADSGDGSPENGSVPGSLREPIASFVPNSWVKGNDTGFESFNFAPFPTTVQKISTGQYFVQFDGMGDNGGNVHVVAVGNNNRRCTVSDFRPSDNTLNEQIWVKCRRGSDTTYADSKFYVYYTQAPVAAWDRSDRDSHEAFVYSNIAHPSQATYTPSLAHNYNRGGGSNTVTRLGEGTYRVNIPNVNLTRGGGTVMVTAVTSGANYCKVLDWYPEGTTERVFVDCYNGEGDKSDTRFTMLFLSGSSLDAYYGGYAWLDGSPTNADPNPYWAYDADTLGMDCVDANADRLVEQAYSSGVYRTGFIGQLNREHHALDVVLVTAVGPGSNYCKLLNYPSPSDDDPQGVVTQTICYDKDGVRADSGHNVLIDYGDASCQH